MTELDKFSKDGKSTLIEMFINTAKNQKEVKQNK